MVVTEKHDLEEQPNSFYFLHNKLHTKFSAVREGGGKEIIENL